VRSAERTAFALTAGDLSLLPLVRSDANELHALWTTPSVRRFLWDGEVIPFERTLSVVDESARLFAGHGFGLWAARSGSDPGQTPSSQKGSDPGQTPDHRPRLTGFAGFWHFREPPELELLYGVADDWWGRRVATKIASAVISYGFTELQMLMIRASTDAANAASIRVLEKLGFSLVNRATIARLDTLFYELSRDTYHSPALG
jgi:[ribosomal protein S5]-alanine N-acetyltransferase